MSDIEEELERLGQTMQTINPEGVSLEGYFSGIIRFFERFSILIEHLSDEEKKTFNGKLADISQRVQGMMQKFIDATEMSEEGLLQTVEQKEHFGSQKWALYDEARKQVIEFAKQISLSLAQSEPAPSPEAVKPPKIEHPHGPRPKRSEWMKS